MVIDMNEAKLTTLEQIKAFLKGTEAVEFPVCGKDCYGPIGDVLRRFRYGQLRRAGKGVILRYLERTTGYSRQQITRLVKRWRTGKKRVKVVNAFCAEYLNPSLHFHRPCLFAVDYAGSGSAIRSTR